MILTFRFLPKHLSVLFLITIATCIYGQTNYILKGRVSDGKDALAGSAIVIKKMNGKDIIKADIADKEGSFELSFYAKDSVLLDVTFIGYEPYISYYYLSQEIIDLGEIRLLTSSVKVGEVTVTANKTFATQKIDRLVINPEALISNAGITGLELLERSPGLTVDMNGNISIRGKSGVMVFIDDKPSYLTGGDLANYLRSMPSSSIASIEIMTNPPAKYDAAGNAGIINIRLKKNIAIGWNGGLNLSFGQGRYSRSNNSFNINYRRGKFNYFANVSGNYNKSYQDLTIERNYFDLQGRPLSSFVQKTFIIPTGRNGNLRTGFDFYLNDKITLGLATGGLLTNSDRNLTNKATVTDRDQKVTSFVDADNPTDIQFNNFFINGNATVKLKNKAELTANLDLINYDNKIEQVLTNRILSPDRSLLNTSILESDLPTDLAISSLKLDYLKPIKQGRFEAGVKSSLVKANNKAQFYDLIAGERKTNNEFSNNFLYDENINAA